MEVNVRKIFIISFVLLFSCSLMAQTRTGNIYGTIVDEEGNPLPGVTVTLTGMLTAPTPAVTNQQGKFRFLSLSPARDYILKAELQGFKTTTRGNIIIAAGANVEIALTMEIGSISEEVTVTAPTPVVDTKKTTIGINIDHETLQSLPSSRDPWDIINLAPSVVITMDNVGGIDAGQQPGFSGKGASDVLNIWSMDGMVVTETAALGASFGYYDYDVFDEMNVTVGGSDVSVQTAGVQVNMVTQRGGNKLSFGGRFYLVDPWFQSENITDELMEEGLVGTDKFREFRDFGFNVGFPVIKDKLWFWGAYGVQDIETITLWGNNDDTLLSTLAGKINLQIIPENRLEIFAQGNRKQKYGRDQTDENPQGLIQRPIYHFGFPVLKIQDEHMFGDALFVSAKWGIYDGGFEFVPVMDPDLENLSIWDNRDKRWYGSTYIYSIKKPTYQSSLSATYFNDDLLGVSHEAKFGFEYSDRNQARDESRVPGNAIVEQNYIDPTVDFDGDGLPDIPTDPNFKRLEFSRGYQSLSGSTAISAFFSDTVSFGRFNLILGLRYDRQHPDVSPHTRTAVEKDNPVWTKNVNSQTMDLLDNLLPGAEIPEKAGIDANGDKYYWTDWSPRLGLTWDVTGDGKTIAKLSFNQFGSYMGIGEAGRYVPGGAGGWMDFWWIDNGDGMMDFTELYWDYLANYQPYRVFDNAGNFIGDWSDAADRFWGGYDYQNPTNLTDPYTLVDADAQGGRTTEVILSLEREIFPDFGVQVNATYRRYGNDRLWYKYFPDTGVLESQDMYVEWKAPPANIPGIGDTKEASEHVYYYASQELTAYSPWEWIKKRPDYHENYYGIDLVANKRLSNKWMLSGSFSLQTKNRVYGDQGFLSPNNVWAFEGTPGGTLPRWMLKLSGLYQLPYDINVSFIYKGREGWMVDEYFQLVDYTIPNPLSRSHQIYMTKAGSTRLPTMHYLTFRVEKMFRLGDTGRIYFMADLFNALNLNTVDRRRDINHGTYYIYPDPSQNTFVPDIRSFNISSIMNPRVLRLGVRFQF